MHEKNKSTKIMQIFLLLFPISYLFKSLLDDLQCRNFKSWSLTLKPEHVVLFLNLLSSLGWLLVKALF